MSFYWPDFIDYDEENMEIAYNPHRFNIVPSDENEPEDYCNILRGCLYDIFYLTDEGKHLLAGQMQRHCDGEGELWLSGILPDTDSLYDSIVDSWNATYPARLNYFFKVNSMD